MIPWQMEHEHGEALVRIELRSTPLWLAQHYLLKLGGRVIEVEKTIEGSGWRAELSRGEPIKLGSLRIGVGYLRLSGEEQALDALMQSLGLWLMRGGG